MHYKFSLTINDPLHYSLGYISVMFRASHLSLYLSMAQNYDRTPLPAYRTKTLVGQSYHLSCPSSYKMGHRIDLSYGGSGSSVGLIMQPAFDVASGVVGLSVS